MLGTVAAVLGPVFLRSKRRAPAFGVALNGANQYDVLPQRRAERQLEDRGAVRVEDVGRARAGSRARGNGARRMNDE